MYSVEKWAETAVRILKYENRYFAQNIDSSSVDDFKKLINISIFKIFIENDEVNLNTLEIETPVFYDSCFCDILKLILQNKNFIQNNIKNLKLYLCNSSDFSSSYNYENTIIKNYISQIINLNQNLKKISLCHDNLPLYQSILTSKDFNYSNTLNTIIFSCVNFNREINLNDVFEQLNVLESVHIIYCSFNTSFIQQVVNLTKPFKLKSLFINEILSIESLQLLLQKSGCYLENCGYGFELYNLFLKQKLLELFVKYCRNIKFLDLCEYENQLAYPIFNLIENNKQNLNYLSINIFQVLILSTDITNYISCSSFILKNLGQVLPSRLEYLSLTLRIKANDFCFFLKSSQNTFINKLLINNKEGEDILPYIKKYIMKKRKVKYLAIMDSAFENTSFHYNFNNNDLFCLKDEVEEFRLYDIKVQNYDDSLIGVYNYIKEID
ncbi:hypothetical protein GLOIN_2v1885053 [Rhizophagus clarus]|nr:hypothetical protein GLOIN_2v1885053 [Rhizophagus clarus]